VTLPVAVLAGGLGTRLRPLTERVPKILIDVAGRPFAEHQLELFRAQGVSDVVYCLGYLAEQVVDVLGDGRRWGMRLEYVFDGRTPLGTGGAVRAALPRLGRAFFVTYGDSYLQCDFGRVEASFRASGMPGLMTVFHNEDRWVPSNAEYSDGFVLSYDKQSAATRHFVDYGLGILTPEVFEPWRDIPGRFDLADVYRALVDRGALAGCEIPERFYEIGSAEGLEETRALIESRQRAAK
jgi:NDP-sugar pyrophosphorylase family protein